ncbi:MAG: acyl-CoA reductase, partial [Bacteroidetes bacterium]
MDTNFTTLSQRIDAFHKLGRFISSELLAYKSGKKSFSELFDGILFKAYLKNNWFTEENQIKALEGILQFLDRELLNEWLSKYESVPHSASAKVAVIMAGNIPMVGFHDFLSVLMAGHRIIIKLSSDDKVLLPYFAQKLTDIDSAFSSLIHFEEEKLSGFDAVIATGSNNSARYFEYYFSAVPHIIRKNRNSVAIITGNETEQELKLLAEDIFTYFGLGCRNVSKIYIPEGYDVN